jgi:hypothetical protein
MKVPELTTEQQQAIVQEVCAVFHTFGGGRRPSGNNPLEAWTADKPPIFALGVDVGAVVAFVVQAADVLRAETDQTIATREDVKDVYAEGVATGLRLHLAEDEKRP